VKDITVEERVKYGDKTYKIVNVANVDEVGRMMVMEIRLVE